MKDKAILQNTSLKAQFMPIIKRLPAYVKLGWRLLKEPRIPQRYKLPLYATVLYQVTPVHFIMTPIPILGQIDVWILLILSIIQMLKHCPEDIARHHLKELGLEPTQMEEDLNVLRVQAKKALKDTGQAVSTGTRFAGRVTGGFTRRTIDRHTKSSSTTAPVGARFAGRVTLGFAQRTIARFTKSTSPAGRSAKRALLESR